MHPSAEASSGIHWSATPRTPFRAGTWPSDSGGIGRANRRARTAMDESSGGSRCRSPSSAGTYPSFGVTPASSLAAGRQGRDESPGQPSDSAGVIPGRGTFQADGRSRSRQAFRDEGRGPCATTSSSTSDVRAKAFEIVTWPFDQPWSNQGCVASKHVRSYRDWP